MAVCKISSSFVETRSTLGIPKKPQICDVGAFGRNRARYGVIGLAERQHRLAAVHAHVGKAPCHVVSRRASIAHAYGMSRNLVVWLRVMPCVVVWQNAGHVRRQMMQNNNRRIIGVKLLIRVSISMFSKTC